MNFYCQQRSHVFTGVCDFVHRGVSVPACTTGHMTGGSLSSREVSVRGVSVWGSLSGRGCLCLAGGVSVWGSLSGSLCSGGSLSRGGLCLGGPCLGSLSRGLCLGCLIQGCLCPRGSLSRRVLNIGYISNETNTDVRMYNWRIYSSRDLDALLHKVEVKMYGKYTGFYTIATIAWDMWEMLLEVIWQEIINRSTIAWETVNCEN